MKVTIFGATGGIGSLVVETLLMTPNTSVTAFVRNIKKVPDSWREKGVLIVEGTLSEPEKIDLAIAGADAVINAMGPSMERTATGFPLVEGTRNILTSMATHNVKRYIGHATPGIKDPHESLTFTSRLVGFLGNWMFPRGFKEMIDSHDLIVNDERVDWTIIRFIAPNDKPKTGKWRAGFFGTDSIRFAVTRGDIADFTVQQLSDTKYFRRMPAISN